MPIQPEQELSRRKLIAERAAQLRAINPSSLYRKESLGELNFEVGSATLTRVFSVLGSMNEASLSMLPWNDLERAERFVGDVASVVGMIQQFRIATSNPVQERNSLLDRLDTSYREFFQSSPVATSLVRAEAEQQRSFDKQVLIALDESKSRLGEFEKQQGAEFVKLQKKQEEKLDDLQREHRAKVDELQKQQAEKLSAAAREAESALDVLRKASGAVALQKYSKFFEDEAKEAKTTAKMWLICAVIVAVAVLAYLLWLVFYWAPSLPNYTPTQAVQAGGAKIALFTVVFYLLSWCGRNFKAQWHIHVINRHRANTLNALEAFASSASNAQTREAILIHASSAIFSQVHTGFIPDQSDAASNTSILEIVRGAKE